MLELLSNLGELARNKHLFIVFTRSTGTNDVLNEHENLGQYVSYAKLTGLMPCYSYPAN